MKNIRTYTLFANAVVRACLAIFVCIAITLIVYWKIPAQGVIPFPGNLLVGRFFPFNTMEWEGYPLGVPYKEFINADVIRQLFPWREMAMEQLKQGNLPWWNPYSFSGSPLLSNIQTAVFYPLNILYFITSSHTAWIIGVLLQPILAMLFMWMYVTKLGFSRISSLATGMIFAFSGFMMVWWEYNTIGHAAIWLPLALWAIERFNKSKQKKHLLILCFSIIASFTAGHIQTSLYCFILIIAYAAFRIIFSNNEKAKKRRVIELLISVGFSLFIVMLLYLPTFRFLFHTPRATQADSEIYHAFIIPWKNLITIVAPDFFGNPASQNYWGKDYGEFQLFFGNTALLFFLLGLLVKPTKIKNFFSMVFIISLAAALPTGIPQLLHKFHLPLLSTSAPSRIIVLIHFSASIIAGYGIHHWLLRKPSKKKHVFLILSTIFFLVWTITGYKYFSSTVQVDKAQWLVSIRNLIIPTAVTVFMMAMVYLKEKDIFQNTKFSSFAFPIFMLIVMCFEYSYFTNKYQTFSQPRFFFPTSQIFSKLHELSRDEPFRFFGDYTASVGSNIWLPYKIYGAEGYDALYVSRYGQLLTAAETGILPNSIPRSDANLEPNNDSFQRRRLQDILGIRYILDKTDFPSDDWVPDRNKFPEDRYRPLWREGKFIIFENTGVLPRAFLIGKAIVREKDEDIISTLFSQDFDPASEVILETQPPSAISPSPGGVTFVKYQPNQVELKVTSLTNQLLFISDAYYPDWRALIDGIETTIYRANYAFRAIAVSPGEHTIVFFYQSKWLPDFK